jgi:hypothetical protein
VEKIQFNMTQQVHDRSELRERVDRLVPVIKDELNWEWATVHWDLHVDEHGREVVFLDVCHGKDEEMGEGRIALDPRTLDDEVLFRSKLHEVMDAADRLRHWRQSLEKLYAQVREWMAHRSPPPAIAKIGVRIIEERSGDRHDTPGIEMDFDGQEVSLRPVAAWVIGADGRVDLVGPGDRHILVLRDDCWYWVNERPKTVDEKLDERLFNTLIDSVLV